ncbi:MAG: hypothetical protein V2A76_09250 [Planctomycetota bacterium]
MARRKSQKRASKASPVRRRAVSEDGTYFGCSYRESDLLAGERVRKELIADGVGIPTTWDEIHLFYVTHPEISAYRCTIVCRRDWRKFWHHHKAGNWAADRQEFEDHLKRETLGRIASKSAKQLADGFERFAIKIQGVAEVILNRTMCNLETNEPEPYETIASKKDEQGVLSQVRRRMPRPSAAHQIAILDKYTDMMRALLGLPGSRAAGLPTSAHGGPPVPPGEKGAPDEPTDQARRAREAQNPMWRTELGHDWVEPPEVGAEDSPPG